MLYTIFLQAQIQGPCEQHLSDMAVQDCLGCTQDPAVILVADLLRSFYASQLSEHHVHDGCRRNFLRKGGEGITDLFGLYRGGTLEVVTARRKDHNDIMPWGCEHVPSIEYI